MIWDGSEKYLDDEPRIRYRSLDNNTIINATGSITVSENATNWGESPIEISFEDHAVIGNLTTSKIALKNFFSFFLNSTVI